jgi:hypothetical protein
MTLRIVLLFCSGCMCVSAQAPPGTPLLSDDFTKDRELNRALWEVNTRLFEKVAATEIANLPLRLAKPRVSFDKSGMTVSGVSEIKHSLGIQSRQAFTPPFTVQATVMGVVAHANPFALYLVTAVGKFVRLTGNINPENGEAYKIGVNVTGQDGHVLDARPSVNHWYTITITVGGGGNAFASAADETGNVIGRSGPMAFGLAPVHVVMVQNEPNPRVAGPNEAIWSRITIASGRDSLLGKTIASSAPVTQLNNVGTGASGVSAADSGGEKAIEAGKEAARVGRDRQAFNNFLAAAQAGNASAQNDVAFAYEHGIGVAANMSEALTWYQKAAAQGNTWGEVNLRRFYRRGLAGPANPAEADRMDSLANATRAARTQFCTAPTTKAGFLKAEKQYVNTDAGGALLTLGACALTGICASSEPPTKAIDSMAVDQRQLYGKFETDVTKTSGAFACKVLFLRGELRVKVADDSDTAGVLTPQTINDIMANYPTFQEWFNVGRGANGHYAVTLLPSGLEIFGIYSAEVPAPGELGISGVEAIP